MSCNGRLRITLSVASSVPGSSSRSPWRRAATGRSSLDSAIIGAGENIHVTDFRRARRMNSGYPGRSPSGMTNLAMPMISVPSESPGTRGSSSSALETRWSSDLR